MSNRRRPWDREEDEALAVLVDQYGPKHWALVARKLSEVYEYDGRSGKQCRERWLNQLSPLVKRVPWSPTEEQTLLSGHRQFGSRWSEIAKLLPGRTENCVKNHFYSTMRRNLRKLNRIREVPLAGPLPELLADPELARILLDISSQGICKKKDYSAGPRRRSRRLRTASDRSDNSCEELDSLFRDLSSDEATTNLFWPQKNLLHAPCEDVDIDSFLDEAWGNSQANLEEPAQNPPNAPVSLHPPLSKNVHSK